MRRNQWNHSVSTDTKPVHPVGQPISTSTNSGFKVRRVAEETLPAIEVARTWRPSYLVKQHVPKFHTVTAVPYTPPTQTFGSAMAPGARLKAAIIQYVRENVGVTANKLDSVSGEKSTLKASRKEVRVALADLIALGAIEQKAIDKNEKDRLGISQQVRKILTVKE